MIASKEEERQMFTSVAKAVYDRTRKAVRSCDSLIIDERISLLRQNM